MTSDKHTVTSTRRPSHRLLTALIALALSATIAALGPSGASAKPEAKHCISSSGVDLNEFFGVSEPIIIPVACTQMGTGWHWRPSVMPWFMNHTFEVVPEGFEPAGATPLEDFVANFAAVKYVIDPGTRQVRTYVFGNTADLWTGAFRGTPLVTPLTLGTLKPLPPGKHVVETYWLFSAMHCDGFGDATGPGGNCFPAGETQLPTMAFEVTPGHHV